MAIDDDTPIRGRDLRDQTWFWIDKSFVEVFMPHMDAYAFAVYGILCYHVNSRTGVAFPSVATIAKEINASANTVRKALNLLSELGLIRIEHRTKDNEFGEPIFSSNEYELVDVNELAQRIRGGTSPHAVPTSPREVGVLHHVNTNNKNNNKKNLTIYEPTNAAQDDLSQDLDVHPKGELIQKNKEQQATARLSSTPKEKAPRQPTIYGDLFVAIRDKSYGGNENSTAEKSQRAGKDAKALLKAFPDTTATEYLDFVREWSIRKAGADVPRNGNLIDWFETYRKDWKRPAQPNNETYTVIEDDDTWYSTTEAR